MLASYNDARRDGLRVLFDVRCLRRPALCGSDLTCRGGECVSSKYDPEAAPTKTDTQAATAIDSGSAPSSTGIAADKEACDQNGARRCAGFNSSVPLSCEDGRWVARAECTAMQRCDTSEGSTRGTCRAIPSECIGQKPDMPFCKSEMMHVCDADLLRSEADGVGAA